MATSETKTRQVFRDCRAELEHLSPNQFANLVGGGANVRANIDKKLMPADMPSARGVTRPEAVAVQLLVLLDKAGYDLAGFVFDEDGVLRQAPKKR